MAGKRVQKKKRRRGPKLLGTTVILAAVSVLLLAGGPQGAAVNSPLEEPAPLSAEQEEQTRFSQPDTAPAETASSAEQI